MPLILDENSSNRRNFFTFLARCESLYSQNYIAIRNQRHVNSRKINILERNFSDHKHQLLSSAIPWFPNGDHFISCPAARDRLRLFQEKKNRCFLT
mmetsp:Transcript_31858/g.46980  ORF Transcript_31858/g.46980 Transcript_31858/m.46980 type:complete len:96 (+) Transcript_31858:142-429(+)